MIDGPNMSPQEKVILAIVGSTLGVIASVPIILIMEHVWSSRLG